MTIGWHHVYAARCPRLVRGNIPSRLLLHVVQVCGVGSKQLGHVDCACRALSLSGAWPTKHSFISPFKSLSHWHFPSETGGGEKNKMEKNGEDTVWECGRVTVVQLISLVHTCQPPWYSLVCVTWLIHMCDMAHSYV